MSSKTRAMILRSLPSVPDDRVGLVLDFLNKIKKASPQWKEEAKKFLSDQPCNTQIMVTASNGKTGIRSKSYDASKRPRYHYRRGQVPAPSSHWSRR
jgi:hypothetical protein